MKTIISKTVRWLETPEGLVLLNLATGRCYHVNKAASLVWASLVAGSDDSDIAASLVQQCGVPEQDARLKCAGLIQHFKKLELIQETREIQIG
jgi:Coenzyme PQQ synthesis protein D (PqqD)